MTAVESDAPTARGRATETAFLQAARQVFAEQGYLGARVADIARAAGRSPASFYGYFDSKEQLLGVLADQFAADVLAVAATITPATDPWDNALTAVRAYRQAYRDYQPVMVGVFQLSMTDPAFAQRWRAMRAKGIQSVLLGLRGARRLGYARGLDVEVVASHIVTLLESSCYVWYVAGGDALDREVTEEQHVEALAQIWYRAIFFPPSLLGRSGRPRPLS
jgi:AcrR family transcriptional regulator